MLLNIRRFGTYNVRTEACLGVLLDMRAFLDSRLNLAVLMQVAGLVCWQYSMLVGLLLIVAGGVLYRRELRARKLLPAR
jgi:hypothetical protein